MTFLEKVPMQWGPWNHASLTSISKRNAEIKVGIRKGFSLKGLLSIKKRYELKQCSRKDSYQEQGTFSTILGNLIGWMWLKSSIYPKHLKFLELYRISHPRPLGPSFSNFLWEEMIHLGNWTLTQGNVTVEHKKTKIRFRWKINEGHVYGHVKKIEGSGSIQLEFIGIELYADGSKSLKLQENGYQIDVFESEDVWFSTNENFSTNCILELLNKNEQTPITQGQIEQAIEGLITIISLNTIKAPDRGWLTSLMRRFGVIAGGWSMYLWDNSFIGMMAALFDPKIAHGNIKAMCAELTNNGFLPNQANPMARAESISQLPVTSYCALKINRILEKPIENIFPSLRSNNDWWLNNRDPNGYHLLSYGSELKEKCSAALRQIAIYEAGMDNHPMFDNIPVDYHSGCLALYPVCLNSIYALDCESLARLAADYGEEEIGKRLDIRYNNMKHMINSTLYDGETYRNRLWNGDFQEEIYANCLFPLIAGIASQDQAESTVKKVFHSCLTPYGISNCEKTHPAFQQQLSWRGRLLPPMQFLVSEGLRRYGLDKEASLLARCNYRCFINEWLKESHFHESYNGFNGNGDDVSITGEPGHPWAALLPYLSIQDLIDYELWNNGIRVGRLVPIDASITDINIKKKNYTVIIKDKRQIIIQNGQKVMESSFPTILRRFYHGRGEISFEQKGLKQLELRVWLEKGNYRVRINEESFHETFQKDDFLPISLSKLKNEIKIIKD